MMKEKTWEEFRSTGLLLFVNQFLHIFGWAIVIEVLDENLGITRTYPARVKFRGFNEVSTSEAYKKVSKFINENSNELLAESEE